MTVPYTIKFIPAPGTVGTLIEYREVTALSWIVPDHAPNPTTTDEYILELESGKSYFVAVSTVSNRCTPRKAIIPVVVPASPHPCCPETFVLSPDGTFCYKEEVTAPEIITSGMCLAYAKANAAYSGDGAWLYDPAPGVQLPASATKSLLTGQYWKGNPAGFGDESSSDPLPNESVMNRDSVWIDSDCNGQKDALSACSVLQFTYLITLQASKQVFVGIGGDNTFQLDINNVTAIQCGAGAGIPHGAGQPNCAATPPADGQSSTHANFNVWHIVPVNLTAGPNYLTFSAYGDGSTNDALAVIIYDNNAGQIAAAASDSDLNIIFRTGDFKGQRLDIARCPDGWQLDTSGGVGNYVCRRITQIPALSC